MVKRFLSVSRLFVAICFAGTLLGGCASQQLSAAEVCSADWIKPRTDAALNEFRKSTSGTWESLQKSGKKAAANGKLGLLERASVLFSLTRLVNSFQNSQALDDLQLLSTTCNDPQLVRNALTDTMAQYNVPQQYIDLLGELEQFTTLLQQNGGGLNPTN